MVRINLFIGTAWALIFVSHLSTSLSEPEGRACYHAKICVHNAAEKCGIDSKGNLRRFFDTCDIKEYNCLKKTDFVKTPLDKCKSLPPLKHDHNKPEKTKHKPKPVGNEKSKVNDVPDIKEINLNKGEERIEINNREEGNNEHKEGDRREPNVISEEKEDSNDTIVPKRNIEINVYPKSDMADVVEENDDPQSNYYNEDNGHMSAVETENDENDKRINDDHNNEST